MNVDMGRWEPFVRSLVESGLYESADAVIDQAMRLLVRRGELGQLSELRRLVAEGEEDVARGELAPFDPEATLERIRARRSGVPGPT